MAASTGPNPVSAPDQYPAGQGQPGYLSCPGAKVVTWQVSAAAIVYQLGHGSPPRFDDAQLSPEKPLLPIVASTGEACDAIRFRNQTPGQVAQVQITTRP